MREILFRGKRVDNGEWVEGGIVPFDVDSGYIFIVKSYPYASTFPVKVLMQDNTYLIEPETVCQYTGLLDKKKQKIFEGDIVRKRCKGYRGLEIGVIIYDKDAAEFKIKWKATKTIFSAIHMYIDEIEVVGSIFDNPELIEKRWFKWE